MNMATEQPDTKKIKAPGIPSIPTFEASFVLTPTATPSIKIRIVATPTIANVQTLTLTPSTTPSVTASITASTTASATPSTTPSTTPSPTPEPSPTPRPTVAFSGQKVIAHAIALAKDIGPRIAGEASADRAAEYIASQFASYGYDVRRQTVQIVSFKDHGSFLKVLPEGRIIQGRALNYSPAGDVDGRLIPAGFGNPDDFPARGFQGGIALVRRGGGIRFRDKVMAASSHGARAVIIYNNQIGSFRGDLERLMPVPVLGIDGRSGQTLVANASSRRVEATLSVKSEIVERATANVIAQSRGQGVRSLVIGGHYDTVVDSPGGNDNATGTAVVLELARVLSTYVLPQDLTILFVAFGAEETGLHGSRRFVESLSKRQRESIVAMLNYDMIGVGDVLAVGGNDHLTRLAVEVAKEQGWTPQQLGMEIAHRSDHAPFVAARVPALMFHAPRDPHYHTERDTVDRVQRGHLVQFGDLGLAVIQRLVRQ